MVKIRSGLAPLILFFVFMAVSLSAQPRQINLSASPSQTLLLSKSDYGFELQFDVGSFELNELERDGRLYDELVIEGYGHSGRVGEPKLPVASRIVAVPVGASVSFEVLSRQTRQLDAPDSRLRHLIVPAQESVSKSADPASIIFRVNSDTYARNEFTGGELFSIEELGYLRGLRLFQFYYEPLRYNPSSGELSITTSAQIRVNFHNPDLAASADLLARTASFEFDQFYAKSVFNWDPTRTSLVRYPTKMLILTPAAYVSTLQPFVNWKTQQGYEVIVTTVGTGGSIANSTTAINTYMAGLWSSATVQNPAPTYLLIVGDTSTSGNNIIANTGVTSSAHVTDLNYVRLQGTDYLPEMYYGRFSVSSATELTNIINKTLQFQQTTMPDLSYLGKTVLIAGVDATWAPTHGNGAINYAITHYFNSTNGITSNNYFYPASGNSAAQIRANANEGRGYMNYTAHGGYTGWSDPSFSNTDINNMTNTDKYFVAVGNCCITNAFDQSVCFGESIIRAGNKGGVIYIGGTNNTYWDEDYHWAVGYKTPQTAAHAYNANTLGAYDAMFHSHGEAYSNWATTTGETVLMGNMAVQQSTSSRKNYYWEIYAIMGDPSLMPYYGVPSVNVATYPQTVLVGATSMAVTAAPYSRVAISSGGVLYGSQIVPASGNLNFSFNAFNAPGTAKLVISAPGKITRMHDITIAPNSGAYLTVSNLVYADANNNQPEYNETGRFNVSFSNVGSTAANNIVASLSTASPYITMVDASESITSIAGGGSVTRNNAFSYNVSGNIPDQTEVAFVITMVSGTQSWVHNFTQVFGAPQLGFGALTISDPSGNNNGRLDPGETVTVTIPLLNSGAAASLAGTASLTSPTAGITINSGTANLSAISAGASQSLSFNLTAASSMPIGSVASLVFSAAAGSYSAAKTEALSIGIVLEDFESGNFNSFDWVMGGNLPWTISTDAYAGSYSARSGAITHNQTSSMQTTRILSSAGQISFRYKVSSESGYDYLRFFIDGVQQAQWSGTLDWAEASYPVSAGTRTLQWLYYKDGSVSSGSDCAWVDNIIFPASTAPSNFFPPQNLSAIPGNAQVVLNWQAPASGSPTGYKIFRNGALLTTVTALSYTNTGLTNGVSYSYYLKAVYSGGESDPTPTVSATPSNVVISEVILGSGSSVTTNTTASPINVYYKSMHGQSVYTAAELNAAGVFGPISITHLGFNITALPTVTMPNFVVRMKHTPAVNVASWIGADGFVTVYSAASYLPTQTGYNMYQLSSPFEWNGTDNLVVDTAFGLFSSNYSSTGTVQYTSITNGYRYGRSDTVDQTNVFSDGYSSVYRPNLKLQFLPVNNDPAIALSPSSLDFGSIPVGTSVSRSFTISNTGAGNLSGTITTPTGYSVNQRDEMRNTINFTIAAAEQQSFNLSFAPTVAQAYNGNVVITSNDPDNGSINLALTGSAFDPPVIHIEVEELATALATGSSDTQRFTISNNGGQNLEYSMSIVPPRAASIGDAASLRSIAGSTLELNADSFVPGTTQDWVFSVYNASTDNEWLEDVFISFPTGLVVNSATPFTGGSGGDLVPDLTSGDGITINWYDASGGQWGLVYPQETAIATVNVTISPALLNPISLDYQIDGDVYGADPHSLTGSISLEPVIETVDWFSLDNYTGTIAPGAYHNFEGFFSAEGMEPGTYEAVIMVSSNDPLHPTQSIGVIMEVFAGNRPPQINLPDSFSFDKNGSLSQSFSSWVSDPDNDPLALSVSGNSNVGVEINGLQVSFTATQNWIGSELLTFTVSDGSLNASDNVLIHVLPTQSPNWQPVIYPNNSATIFAVVQINSAAAQLNDVVAAFVGDECRAVGEIVMQEPGLAVSTLLVNLAAPGEELSFKIYSWATDQVYPVQDVYYPLFGEVIGQPVPILLNGVNQLLIACPEISLEETGETYRLVWNAIPHADSYHIYAASEPEGSYSLIHSTTELHYEIQMDALCKFYRITAASSASGVGGAK